MPPPFRRSRPTRRWRWVAAFVGLPFAIVLLAFAAYAIAVWLAVIGGVARTAGTVHGLAVIAPVRIARDERGVPHIRAANLHDLYFAQGYVTGGDRLFQIDVTRRYVYGRLSELLGSVTLGTDERSRVYDPAGLVAAQYAHLGGAERLQLQAFADGVNAAAAREPQPPEYRALFARFEPWRPQDSLACGLATVRDLSDGWSDVIARDAVVRALGPRAVDAFFPLSDPAYDVPTVGGPPPRIAPLPPLDGTREAAAARLPSAGPERSGLGSNAFAAGAAHTTTGRALLANDPHLNRGIPGIWYLIDLAAPGVHVAGATLAGTPGVILGHNDRLAWGATNGTVAGPRVFLERFASDSSDAYATESGERRATARVEHFAVRFGPDQTRRYLATRHGFVIEERGVLRHAVQWDAVARPIAALTAFDRLGQAADLSAAREALAAYPGPVQNFLLADVSGRAAYTLAGAIPDGDWGLRVEDGTTTAPRPLSLVPFEQLPRVPAARSAVIVTANNLQYGRGYAYRLSPEYSAPYRAAEIAHRLGRRQALDATAFRSIQADTLSPGERELARRAVAALRVEHADRDADLGPAIAALTSFDGRFTPESRGATVVERLRTMATADLVAAHLPPAVAAEYFSTSLHFVTLLRALREKPHGWFPRDDPDAFLTAEVRALVRTYGRDGVAEPYGTADAVVARHPLASFGFSMWNGPVVPGQGGRFSPAVQGESLGQSFRAVWDVGNWDAGGIDIPLGESGEPGSPHYRDLASRYARHVLTPLPFSAAAVARATRALLVLDR